MSRRALTTASAAVLAVLLAVLGGLHSVPYVVLSPGPAFDTLGAIDGTEVVKLTGRPTYTTDGTLDATTVSVTDGVTLFEALGGWFSRDQAVVPREVVYPPDQTQQQADRQNTQDMVQSQDDALVAAMGALGIKGTSEVLVNDVKADGPADGTLKPKDVITTVDGQPVRTIEQLRARISARRPGEPVRIGYARDGAAGSATLTTTKAEGEDRAVIGITAGTHSEFPVKADIKLKDVGGPSAGLMFALSIVDKLEPGSLTGGQRVAGTGEITPDGKVGEIGGIAQKMRGAKAVGARVFLVPANNCPEARKTAPDGLRLVKVATLSGALQELKALRSGGTPTGC